MNKEYIYKQLDLIENELKDIYDTMVEHNFDLTFNDVKDLIYTANIRVNNIKRELNREDGGISEKINKIGFISLDISKPGRPEVKEEIDKYLDSLIK